MYVDYPGALLAVRGSTALGLALGLLVFGAVGLWARRPTLRHRVRGMERLGRWLLSDGRGRDIEPAVGAKPGALPARLRERHPDWDAARVERVVANRRRRRSGDGEPGDRP